MSEFSTSPEGMEIVMDWLANSDNQETGALRHATLTYIKHIEQRNQTLSDLLKRAVDELAEENKFICNSCGGGDGDHWDDCKVAPLLADAEKELSC